MKIKMTNLRGTVFTRRITLDNNSLTKLLSLFDGYSVEMVPVVQDVSIPVPTVYNWSLVNGKKDYRIVFTNKTIDIIKTTYEDYTEEIVHQFAQFCQTYYEAIFSSFGCIASRMALAPTLKVELSDANEFATLTEKIASTKIFKDTPISTLSFSDVYRVQEDVNGLSVLINYLSNFSSTETVENGALKPIKEVVFAADINTFQLVHNEFDANHLHDFYQKVASWYIDFFKFYFK